MTSYYDLVSLNTLCVIASLILGLLYVYSKWTASFFERRNIKSLPFTFPFVGHMYKVINQKEHFKDALQRHYDSFPGEKYVGFMQMNRPLLMLRDLDLIKQATIKDFDHFVDHVSRLKEDSDTIFGNHLFALTGDRWRDMRATLSPAFTSSKMRNMFQFIAETGEQTSKYYLKLMEQPGNKERGLVELELKDAFTRYANDVIATSAFGIKVNSLDDRNNEFYKMGKESTQFSGAVLVKFFLYTSFPKIMKLLGVQVVEERIKDFFRGLVNNTMQDRERKGTVRHDMIHLLMQAKRGTLKHEDSHPKKDADAGLATVEESQVGMKTVKRTWSDDDIVAQAVLFFIAGFDTAATLMSFLFHELAMQPAIQDKLYEEIANLIKEHGEHLEYNELVKLKYMDMVVSETLRLWPPAVFVDRECVKPYNLPPSSNNHAGYNVQVGEGLVIPIYSIQRDPKYFQDPHTFDPERFNDENKGNIHPLTFIPFGVGPRNCIGSRFALMEIKAVMFHLLANFEVVRTAKTQHPIKVSTNSFSMTPDDGFWVGLKPRNL